MREEVDFLVKTGCFVHSAKARSDAVDMWRSAGGFPQDCGKVCGLLWNQAFSRLFCTGFSAEAVEKSCDKILHEFSKFSYFHKTSVRFRHFPLSESDGERVQYYYSLF